MKLVTAWGTTERGKMIFAFCIEKNGDVYFCDFERGFDRKISKREFENLKQKYSLHDFQEEVISYD